MSLRARILLLVLVATLVPSFAFGVYQWVHRESQVEEARRNLGVLARTAADNLDDKVRGTVQLLHGLSRVPDLDTRDVPACSRFLAGVLARYPQYTGILTLTPQGALHCDSLRSGRTLDVSGRDYFRQVLATHAPAYDVVIGGLTGIAVLQVAYPVLSDEGALKFVLLASLNLSQIADNFTHANEHNAIRMLIWNRGGTLMTGPPAANGTRQVGQNLATSAVFRFAAASANGSTAALPGEKDEAMVWALGIVPEPRGGGARVTLGISNDALLAEADAALRQSLAALVAVSLLTFGAAWYLAEVGIRRQGARIIDAAARLGAGDLHARVGPPYPRGELGAVMATLDSTAAAVQSQRAQLELGRRELERANRMLRVLSGINSLIVRVTDRQALFDDACRIAVGTGRFSVAWIGLPGHDGTQLARAAAAGATAEVMACIDTTIPVLQPLPQAGTLAGRALREGVVVFSNDNRNDPVLRCAGITPAGPSCSVAVLPLHANDRVAGLLTLYAGETGYFDEPELRLLRELAADISFALEHIDKTEKLSYLAYYDPLTGLANNTLLHERLERKIHAEHGQLAVCVLDVDRFKTINDTVGRQGGDELIRQIAARLVGQPDQATRFARVGPDRFAMVLPGVADAGEALERAARSLQACFGPSFMVCGSDLRVSVHCGLAMFPGDGDDAAVLFRCAEAALKRAKSSGHRFLFHTREMTDHTAQNLALENQLRSAVEREEFVLHYQPKVDMATGAMVGLEALIRWQSPHDGLVAPGRFIPVLEQTGLILEVGDWALRQAAADQREWRAAGLEPPRIAVNVSPIQLRQRDFVGSVQRAVVHASAPVGIDLEITESLVMEDIEASIAKLHELRAMGLQIAIDDFGTGYSSLAYLAKLPVAALKIDRAFIQAIPDDPNTATLVQTIVSMAHALHLRVVAEGVETEAQARQLRHWHCDEMQGYLISRPVPAQQVVALLAKQQAGTSAPVPL